MRNPTMRTNQTITEKIHALSQEAFDQHEKHLAFILSILERSIARGEVEAFSKLTNEFIKLAVQKEVMTKLADESANLKRSDGFSNN
jgi:hypothetical protein